MANETTYLIRGAGWLAQALGESADLFAGFTTDYLGFALPPAVVGKPEVANALRKSAAGATKVRDAGKKLEEVATATNETEILLAFLQLGTALAEFFIALDELVHAVTDAITPTTIPDAGAREKALHFAEDLARRVADYGIASGITRHLPQLGLALKILGLLDWQYVPAGPEGMPDRGYVRKGLRLDRLKTLFSDPAGHFSSTIGWGTPAFNPIDIFTIVDNLFPPESSIVAGMEGDVPFLKACLLVRRDRETPPGLEVVFADALQAAFETRTAINDDWDFGVKSSVSLGGGISVKVRPPLAVSVTTRPAATISGELRAFFERNEKKRPFDIIGGTGLVSLSAQNLSGGVGLKAQWDGTAASIDPLFFANLDKLTLKLGSDNADSFVGSLLSKANIEGTFDLGLEWAMSTGLKITASGGIEIALPIHKQLGPIEFATLYLALRIQETGNLSFEISTAIIGSLGHLSASVDRIGAGLDLKFAEKTGGKQGLFDLDLHFKPPNGIGVAINAGVVTGGGYLYIDTERGEYAGAIELTIAQFISVKAIGLITTKMPDGSSGFSLLIIITAEFGTGIQLGFGFTLLGVGGLLGVNRGVRTQPLVEGVRTGAVERIMFPKNVVANAPKIISDLRSYFPAEPGTFLIGPMAKIGWGTPTLVSVSLGIIIQIPPGNIYILGVLKVALPTDEAAVLKLQVAFIGAIEFDKKRIWFFASIFDSRVLFLTIEGEMGLLIAFGDDANFVISIGGFHPIFQPPPMPFPAPKWIAISLIDSDYARVRIEAYFAITSNTVQFGAAADLYFGFSAINVSGHLAFDALFQFSPFYFIITISASFALNAFGFSLLSINIRGSLEGPTPWRVSGSASIHILFFDINVDFDVTWGEERTDVLPPIEVLPLLQAELEKKENWRAQLPESNNLLVSLRKLPEEAPLVLHPVGVLRISQRALPLELTLDKIGNKKPSDVNRVHITPSGGLRKKNDAYEQFAPAQYQDFDDSEKLSRPAYAPERGGLELSAAADFASHRMVRRVIRTEEILIDSNDKRQAARFQGAGQGLFDHFAAGGASARSELSQSVKTKLDPFADEKIAMMPDGFAVVFQKDNRAFTPESFRSEATAREFLARQVERDPNLGELLHVIPDVEKAA